MSVLFGLIHVSDAIVRMELGGVSAETLDATLNPLYAIIYLAAVAFSWNQRRIGYAIVLALSSLSSWGFFGHASGLTPPNLTEIGRISGVFFVFVVLIGEVASVSALILSVYALTRPTAARASTKKHIPLTQTQVQISRARQIMFEKGQYVMHGSSGILCK